MVLSTVSESREMSAATGAEHAGHG